MFLHRADFCRRPASFAPSVTQILVSCYTRRLCDASAYCRPLTAEVVQRTLCVLQDGRAA